MKYPFAVVPELDNPRIPKVVSWTLSFYLYPEDSNLKRSVEMKAAGGEGQLWVGSGRLSTCASGRQQPRNNHITVVMFWARRAERVAQASMSLSAFRGLQARRVKPILIGLT